MSMLTLDDACKVLARLDCIKESWKDDPDDSPTFYDPKFPYTYIRQELEQKCYVTGDSREELKCFREALEELNVDEVCKRIADGGLVSWLEHLRDQFEISMELVLRSQDGTEENKDGGSEQDPEADYSEDGR